MSTDALWDFAALAGSTTVRATLLVLLVLVALAACRTLRPDARSAAWFATVAACVALPALTLLLPALPITLWSAPTATFAPQGIVLAATPGSAAAGTTAWPWAAVFTVYGVGVAAVLARFLASFRSLSALEGSATRADGSALSTIAGELASAVGVRQPVLLLSDSVSTPMTWGWLDPRVVLPADAVTWPHARLRNALLHELCHIRRRDSLRTWILQVAVALHWFNPFVHFAARRARFEAERACDEFVLGNGGEPADYASQLVELMRRSRGTTLHAGLALGSTEFARRVAAILAVAKRVSGTGVSSSIVPAAAILALGVAIAACEPTTAPGGERAVVTTPNQVARDDFDAEIAALQAQLQAVSAALAERDIDRLNRDYEEFRRLMAALTAARAGRSAVWIAGDDLAPGLYAIEPGASLRDLIEAAILRARSSRATGSQVVDEFLEVQIAELRARLAATEQAIARLPEDALGTAEASRLGRDRATLEASMRRLEEQRARRLTQ